MPRMTTNLSQASLTKDLKFIDIFSLGILRAVQDGAMRFLGCCLLDPFRVIFLIQRFVIRGFP